jgi:hypothetical protein
MITNTQIESAQKAADEIAHSFDQAEYSASRTHIETITRIFTHGLNIQLNNNEPCETSDAHIGSACVDYLACIKIIQSRFGIKAAPFKNPVGPEDKTAPPPDNIDSINANLYSAAYYGKPEELRKALESGASLNRLHEGEQFPLQRALIQLFNPEMTSPQEKYLECIEILANVSAHSYDRYNPRASFQHVNSLAMILDEGFMAKLQPHSNPKLSNRLLAIGCSAMNTLIKRVQESSRSPNGAHVAPEDTQQLVTPSYKLIPSNL